MRTRLARYLDDHLAGAFAASQMVETILTSDLPPEQWKNWFRSFLIDLREDRAEVMRVQHALGLKGNRLKHLSGRVSGLVSRVGVAEGLGKYTPFSLFLQLESLSLGIEGKRILWLALHELAGSDLRLMDVDFEALEKRAAHQRRTVEKFRRQAALWAFSTRVNLETEAAEEAH